MNYEGKDDLSKNQIGIAKSESLNNSYDNTLKTGTAKFGKIIDYEVAKSNLFPIRRNQIFSNLRGSHFKNMKNIVRSYNMSKTKIFDYGNEKKVLPTIKKFKIVSINYLSNKKNNFSFSNEIYKDQMMNKKMKRNKENRNSKIQKNKEENSEEIFDSTKICSFKNITPSIFNLLKNKSKFLRVNHKFINSRNIKSFPPHITFSNMIRNWLKERKMLGNRIELKIKKDTKSFLNKDQIDFDNLYDNEIVSKWKQFCEENSNI